MNHVQDDGVKEFLVGIQLEQFYWQVRNKLHVSQLSHFDHVNETDLDSLGMAKPEQRRLSDALKKARKKSLFSSFRRKKSKKATSPDEHPATKIGLSTFYGPASSSLTCLINEQSLELQEMLGNGAFGYVRRGVWNKDQIKKVDVAVKCLKYSTDEKFLQMQEAFIKEANAMTLLDHPNIVKLYGIVLSLPMKLVLEFAVLGCLLPRLRNEPHNFLINNLCDYAVQIASGMAYLESQRFIHRDLAARNILMESYEKVKIGDFGMMRALSGDEQYFTMDAQSKVAFAWCAPESLKLRRFSHVSDVWAFGITVMELFSYGGVPWPGCDGAEILAKIDQPACERPKKPRDCPSQIYKLMLSQCWSHEPHQRSSFSSLKRALEQLQPPIVKALHKYDSKNLENLSFIEGDKISLLDASCETSWWFGQNMTTGKTGKFPAELVDSNMRPGLALSPPKSLSDQIKHMKSVKQPSSRKTSSCDGKIHSYEYPVPLKSPEGDEARTLSGRSVDSDFTSSGECDSGYSSSSDRFSRWSSLGSRLAGNRVSYENCEPPLYEPMIPCSASEPIPIPGNGQRECLIGTSSLSNRSKGKKTQDTALTKEGPMQLDPQLPPPLPARNNPTKEESDKINTSTTSQKRLSSSASQRGRSREHFYENQEVVTLREPTKQVKRQSRESQQCYENVSSPTSKSPSKRSSYENWEEENSKLVYAVSDGDFQNANSSLPNYENVSPTQGKGFATTRFSFDLKKDPLSVTEEYEVMVKPSLNDSCSKETKYGDLSDAGFLKKDSSRWSASLVAKEEYKTSQNYENCHSFDNIKQQRRPLSLDVGKTETCSFANRLSHSAPSEICVNNATGCLVNSTEMERKNAVNQPNEQKLNKTRKSDAELHRFHSTGDINNHVCADSGSDLAENDKFPLPPPRRNRPSSLRQTGRSQSDCTNTGLKLSKTILAEAGLESSMTPHAYAGEYTKLKDINGKNTGEDIQKKALNASILDASVRFYFGENIHQVQSVSQTGYPLSKSEESQCRSSLSQFSYGSAMNESIPVEDIPVLPPKRNQGSECSVSRSNSWSASPSSSIMDSQQKSTLISPGLRPHSECNSESSAMVYKKVPFSHSLPSGAPLTDYRQLSATLGYDDVPPPLPKKMSRTKSPAIPPRIDLGQT